MEILRIQAQDTYIIRKLVVGQRNKREFYKFTDDHSDQTFHLGGIIDKKLVSVASFYFKNHQDIGAPYQYRLRGMGTLPEFRGKGIGSALVKTAIPIILQNQGSILWCYSKESSISFYLKMGLRPLGNIFNYKNKGPHQLMSAKLL